MNWIAMTDLKDEEKIWVGSIVRKYNIGLNVLNKEDDYLEYLISYIYNNSQYLQLTCLSQGEAGNVLCVLKKDLPNHYALGKELKKMFGIKDTFFYLE